MEPSQASKDSFHSTAKLLTLPSSYFRKHSSPKVVAKNVSMRQEKF